MGLLIDTSIFIRAERSGEQSASALAPWGSEEWYLSCITASELLHGVHRATDSGINARRAAFVEALLDEIPVLSIDLATARAHAQLWAHLAAAGRMIGPRDLWLAATCISRDLGLLTVNRREFERVPGLRLECWE
jgi:predicted nucleic acid-binding protein